MPPPSPLKFSQPTSPLSKFQILVGMTWIMLAHHISVVTSCCTSLGIVFIKIIAVLRIFQFKRLSKTDNFFLMLVFKRRCEQNKFSLSIVSFVPVLYSFSFSKIEKLRGSIQHLVRSAHPLGKIMDYIQVGWPNSYRNQLRLTLSCKMLKNGQTYF